MERSTEACGVDLTLLSLVLQTIEDDKQAQASVGGGESLQAAVKGTARKAPTPKPRAVIPADSKLHPNRMSYACWGPNNYTQLIAFCDDELTQDDFRLLKMVNSMVCVAYAFDLRLLDVFDRVSKNNKLELFEKLRRVYIDNGCLLRDII